MRTPSLARPAESLEEVAWPGSAVEQGREESLVRGFEVGWPGEGMVVRLPENRGA